MEFWYTILYLSFCNDIVLCCLQPKLQERAMYDSILHIPVAEREAATPLQQVAPKSAMCVSWCVSVCESVFVSVCASVCLSVSLIVSLSLFCIAFTITLLETSATVSPSVPTTP